MIVFLSIKDITKPTVYEAAGLPIKEVKGVPVEQITDAGPYAQGEDGSWECKKPLAITEERGMEMFKATSQWVEEILAEYPTAFCKESVKLPCGDVLQGDTIVKTFDPRTGDDITVYAYPVYTETGEDTGKRIPLDVFEP